MNEITVDQRHKVNIAPWPRPQWWLVVDNCSVASSIRNQRLPVHHRCLSLGDTEIAITGTFGRQPCNNSIYLGQPLSALAPKIPLLLCALSRTMELWRRRTCELYEVNRFFELSTKTCSGRFTLGNN